MEFLQGMDDADSPMADTESIYPDTSSMTDLAHVGRSMQGLKLHNSHSEYVVSQPTATTGVGSVNSLTEAVTIVKSQSDRCVLAEPSTFIVFVVLILLILPTI